jgi:hypothetical protein
MESVLDVADLGTFVISATGAKRYRVVLVDPAAVSKAALDANPALTGPGVVWSKEVPDTGGKAEVALADAKAEIERAGDGRKLASFAIGFPESGKAIAEAGPVFQVKGGAAAAPAKPAPPAEARKGTPSSALKIHGSVGQGGENHPEDVKIVQEALVRWRALDEGSFTPGTADDATVKAIRVAQMVFSVAPEKLKASAVKKESGKIEKDDKTEKNLAKKRPPTPDLGDCELKARGIPWIHQFDPDWVPQDKIDKHSGCKDTSKHMIQLAGFDIDWDGDEHYIWNKQHESDDGHVIVDPDKMKACLAYLDAALAEGKPVLVGIGHKPTKSCDLWKRAEHWVVVVGKGTANGKPFYRFFDPGTRHDDKGGGPKNRFYLLDDGKLQCPKNYAGDWYDIEAYVKTHKAGW